MRAGDGPDGLLSESCHHDGSDLATWQGWKGCSRACPASRAVTLVESYRSHDMAAMILQQLCCSDNADVCASECTAAAAAAVQFLYHLNSYDGRHLYRVFLCQVTQKVRSSSNAL